MSYSLPHQVSASERESRQSQISLSRSIYQYSVSEAESSNIRAPHVLPESEEFSNLVDNTSGEPVVYQDELDDSLGKMVANGVFHAFFLTRNFAKVRHDTLGDLEGLEDQLADDPTIENMSAYYDGLASSVTAAGTADQTKEYLDLYQNWSKNGVRGQGAEIFSDEVFANQAVAGPCPTVIKKVSFELLSEYRTNGLPLTDDVFLAASPFTANGDTNLETMIAEDRLYVQDFSMLAGLSSGHQGADSDENRFVYSPVAFYAVTADGNPRLLPIAIQMRQNDRDPAHWDPVFVPHMPNAMAYGADVNTADWSWMVAKASVSCSSQIYHEFFEHLGRSHFLMESVAMATNRCLSINHPVYAILKPHLLGTLAINDFGRSTLVNDGGTVDRYMSCTIEDFRQSAARAIYETDLLSLIPAVDLANREVNGIPYYPYRDDSVPLWNAIHAYVSEFLGVFYASSGDLVADLDVDNGGELGDWWRELTTDLELEGSTGVLKGLNFGTLENLEDLVNVITFIIYTASVHHAAVNYPQGDYYSNALLCPATVSRPTPVPGHTNKAYFMEFLPPETQAIFQMNQMMVLASFRFTRLGYFESGAFNNDPRIDGVVAQFQNALADIGAAIDSRNAALPATLRYHYMHPNNIPQSTNI
ncbi:lipoxygenase family protein [Ketobacter alkanivorans]|nr:lipoxygenase family protein [Ketobacter alkanivorans]